MPTDLRDELALELPLLTQNNSGDASHSKPIATKASALLAASKLAKSSANPYKTGSAPIDRLIGPFMRPGFGLQISSPPGAYIEQLLLGLIKSVTASGKEVFVLDTQNKLIPQMISLALGNEEHATMVYHHACYGPHEVVSFFDDLNQFLSTHEEISLLICSSLSFPIQREENFSKRIALVKQIRETIVKVCKQYNLLAVISTNMSMYFVNSDGSRGTFDDNTTAVMKPQIDLSCKSISSLVISRDSRKSGRAVLTIATTQKKLRAEFDYVGLEFRDKAPQ
ncbi:hypothetical protein BU17DRAFT_91604 [Hysterangium stoloniferum]|nr:hypothetical protein BU17DRAFT_91604 [Hysterangium stoloniferum]